MTPKSLVISERRQSLFNWHCPGDRAVLNHSHFSLFTKKFVYIYVSLGGSAVGRADESEKC